MPNIVLPLVILVGYVSGTARRHPLTYDAFDPVDPYFDSSLSCYNCI